jgi:protein PET117
MSRASKIFLGSSIVVSGAVIYGVHWIQKYESDVSHAPQYSQFKFNSNSSWSHRKGERTDKQTMYQGVLRDEARLREKALALQSQAVSHSSIPLNTPSAPIQQPAPVMDADCETCRISPPPQLLEAQSSEERKRERELRGREYYEQKGLAERLGREQGEGGRRMV